MEMIRMAFEKFFMMNAAKKFLDKVSEPGPDTIVHKDECLYTYDTAESPTGLYINMNSYLCFGKEYAAQYAAHSGNHIFLHVKKERIMSEADNNSQGRPGGPEARQYQVNDSMAKVVNIERIRSKVKSLTNNIKDELPETAEHGKFNEVFELVLLKANSELTLPVSVVPNHISNLVNLLIVNEIQNKTQDEVEVSSMRYDENRPVSKFSMNLYQLQTNKKVSNNPLDWRCEVCGIRENLWMNLTDGSILCGRKYADGSGGNNHALEHYLETGFPLAVKLGTIQSKGIIDVYSYDEDEMVNDLRLNEHLKHFGLNIYQMKKSDKTMMELEMEFSKNKRYLSRDQLSSSGEEEGPKKDGDVKFLSGPGLTGIINMGNSCYINSVMQVLFSIEDFRLRFTGLGAKQFFHNFPLNPLDDFNIQMSKLGNGLWSGHYSKPNDGIRPLTFKNMIGKDHPDYGSRQQQDAYLFFLHIVDLLHPKFKGLCDPSDSLRFCLEERIECNTSKKVKYSLKPEITLNLEIPLHKAINIEEVHQYQKRHENQKYAASDQNVVRYIIPLRACLQKYFASELIEEFYSTAVNAATSARKRLRMASMPDYLMLHMKKFTFDKDWNPFKLDVSIDMPDRLNLEEWRGVGLRPEESQLSNQAFKFDFSIIEGLLKLGHPPDAAMRAVYSTKNRGLEVAKNWLAAHSSDINLNEPFIEPGSEANASISQSEAWNRYFPKPQPLVKVMSFGYNQNQAARALDVSNGDVELARQWLQSHASELDELASPVLRNGPGSYKLVAFISHVGPSCQNGHYIAHILKGEHWVMFNDERVTLDKHPDKDLGYMYLYKRLV